MTVDLLNFGLLALAVVYLNTTATNLLQLDLTQYSQRHLGESCFWLLLAVYWVLIMLWTYISGIYGELRYPKFLIGMSLGIIGLLILESILTKTFGSASASRVSNTG